MNNERRRHTRVAVEVDVDVSVQLNKKHCGRVTDISEAGLFVETDNHVEKSNFVVIKFSGERIMFGATVRRVVETGFGAEFGSMNDAHRKVISRFIPEPKKAKVSLVVQMPTAMLLCDDGAHSILANELEKAGFAVLEVRSIDKVISSMERFDVVAVISDYVVGGKDTLSTLKEIQQEQKRDFPVVMYSGRHDIPYKTLEGLGIKFFSKSSTIPKNLVSHIKKGLSGFNK
jgi:CheY-like chemotaxis protein